jgi:hypothetical protein
VPADVEITRDSTPGPLPGQVRAADFVDVLFKQADAPLPIAWRTFQRAAVNFRSPFGRGLKPTAAR